MTAMRGIGVGLLVASFLGSLGCESFRAEQEDYDDGYWQSGYPDDGYWGGDGYSYEDSALDLRQGALGGDYAGVVLESTQGSVSGFAAPDYGFVEVSASRTGAASMALIDFLFDPADLQPGDIISASINDYDAEVTLLGCSGPRPMEWVADTVADQVEIRVEEGEVDPGAIRIHFTATFYGYESAYGWEDAPGGSLSGSFELVRSE